MIYLPVAMELQTQAAVLGVALNDSIEERNADNYEIAWRMVRLAATEWDRLAAAVTLLLNVIYDHLPAAPAAISGRTISAYRFKSRVMVEYVRMHQLLDQLVFRSRPRFQLHVRVLRRAVETLTNDFRHTHRHAERDQGVSRRAWDQLDLDFHDFDLITKESLLAFRSFLPSLPDACLDSLARDLRPILQGGMRARAVRSEVHDESSQP